MGARASVAVATENGGSETPSGVYQGNSQSRDDTSGTVAIEMEGEECEASTSKRLTPKEKEDVTGKLFDENGSTDHREESDTGEKYNSENKDGEEVEDIRGNENMLNGQVDNSDRKDAIKTGKESKNYPATCSGNEDQETKQDENHRLNQGNISRGDVAIEIEDEVESNDDITNNVRPGSSHSTSSGLGSVPTPERHIFVPVESPEVISNPSDDPGLEMIEPNLGSTGDTESGNDEMDNSTSSTYRPSLYLQRYWDIFYYTGNILFKVGRIIRDGSWLSLSLSIIQKMFFWVFAISSLFNSIFSLKYHLLRAISTNDANYNTLVFVAFHLVAVFGKIYVIYNFSFKAEKPNRIIESMKSYEDTFPSKHKVTKKVVSRKMKLVTLLAILTFAVAVAKPIFYGGNEINVKKFFSGQAEQFKTDIYSWKYDDMENATIHTDTDYQANLTITTVGLGSIVIFHKIANLLQTGLVFDLIIVIGIVVLGYVKEFKKEVKEITENVPKENIVEYERLQKRREVAWKKYEKLKKIHEAVNDMFDPIFKVLHARNLLSYAFFMTILFLQKSSWPTLALFVINLVKAEIGYYLAGKIADVNDDIRKWIRKWARNSGYIMVDGERVHFTVIVDELDREPFGFGKGNFLINQTFHYKFLGLVGSVFLSMADDDNDN